jgi:16S rRNA (guanine966-N2)-methyltransferase
VRVVGGIARGRSLKAPASATVRPTSARAREAIFDALGHIGGVDGASVLDLFAGSGALGIEALSRGASSAIFVDHDRSALEVVEKNLTTTRLGQPGGDTKVRLIRRDAVSYLANGSHFDLAFVDPPYTYEQWPKILRFLDAEIAVLESNQPIELGDRYELYRSYRYGGTLVDIVRRERDARTGGAP